MKRSKWAKSSCQTQHPAAPDSANPQFLVITPFRTSRRPPEESCHSFVGLLLSSAHDMGAMRFYDFFAGAGLATLGLAPDWECAWANDIDPNKAWVYRANFGDSHFHLGDVARFGASDLPNNTQLAWASFPCQDLSLAGWQRGLSADRSGTFWSFWKIMRSELDSGQRPPIIVIENVLGLLYGDSFAGLCEALAALGMQYGALVIDARQFVPQSRPRVFIVAVDSRVNCSAFSQTEGVPLWTPPALQRAYESLSISVADLWRWWSLPAPARNVPQIDEVIEDAPTLVEWHTEAETRRLLAMMDKNHRAKIEKACRLGGRSIGFVYKRIREDVQRAEVRFDGIAGCLRTPKGGSSRQTVLVIENGKVRSRLLSPREAARLMGVPDSFKLPPSYNAAYKAMGDAVAVPVVRWLSKKLLTPLASAVREKIQGEHNPSIRRLLVRAERRADGWSMEHKRMAPKKLADACLNAVAVWYHELDESKSTALNSFIACAGIKVAELAKEKWPIARREYVSTGGRFRSTGPFIQSVLKRFGEEREYTSEGGRTTGSCIEAAASLIERLSKIPEFTRATPRDRASVVDKIQEWIYLNIVKPSLDSEGLRVDLSLEKIPPEIIGDILNAAKRQSVSGAVAQHLVGAKLALRFTDKQIENYSHTTQDKQLGRKGDFEVNDTIFHVTMTPGESVVEKCTRNAREGFNAVLLIPQSEFTAAQVFVARSNAAGRIWVKSIEEFVGQNLAEIGEFKKDGFRDNLKCLLETYNQRVAAAETRRDFIVKIPENF